MQVSSTNPMVGLEGRSSLLVNLADALRSNPSYFGVTSRPGNIVGEPELREVHRPQIAYDSYLCQTSSNPSRSQTGRHGSSIYFHCGQRSSRALRPSGPRRERRWAVSHSATCGLATR